MSMIDISWLVEHGPCKKFKSGDIIPCPGGSDEAGKSMYILLVGSVDVYKSSAAGGMQKISTLISGDVFGGREYFTDVSDFKYVSGNNTVVYVITDESFNDLSWSRPDILFEILRAAYLPLRKVSNAKLTTAPKEAAKPTTTAKQAATTQEAVKQATTPTQAATAAQPAAKQATAATSNATAAQPAATQATTAQSAKPASVAAVGSIFPEGHKNYTDYVDPMNTQLVFPKDYTCPLCKSSFSDFRVFRSKLYEAKAMRYDLRKFYRDFKTEWYDVITCRKCLFSTFHNYFTDPKPIKKTKIEKELQEKHAEISIDFETERDINYVFTSHYLAILCADGYPTMDKQIRAKLWGNLSWLYEDLGDEDMEKFAAAQSAEIYEQVYTESRLTPVQEQITCLSIAGMQHRAGIDGDNLRRFLFLAKTHKTGDKQYAKIAEDFMYELKIGQE